MTIIAVDDERIALELLVAAITEVLPQSEIHSFKSAVDALVFCANNTCDIAFLDIEMGRMDGITLAKRLKRINPAVNIVFVTAYNKYAVEAVSLYISGYISKPVTKEKIEPEIENLRHPVSTFLTQRIWVQCFGNFEVFVDGEPAAFRYSKTKELLAYLIDRGGADCSNGEIIAALWGDAADSKKKNTYLRELRADLVAVLRAYGANEALSQRRGTMAIVPSKIACDYYLWERGDIRVINAYRGEYMSQYSWGELTLGGLKLVDLQK